MEVLVLKLKLQYFGEELTHWKRPWRWERLKVGGDGDDRGWDGWMASPTRWTWVWASSGSWSWWWTGKPGMLQSMGSQSRTQLSDWTELKWMRSLVYLPQLRQSLLKTKHQLGFLNELQSPWFSYSQLPATQNLIVHAPQLGSEPGASNDFLQSFMIGLLPWDLDQADEKWAQDYLETVHI